LSGASADIKFVLWIYQRGPEHFHIETSFDNATQEYVVITTRDSHNAVSERFTDSESFRLRLESLEREMAGGRWNRVGKPMILANGWKVG
jgi:hypothetical protein